MRAIIVIGSNYGDEGKGMAAAWCAKPYGEQCLNILYNGGPQRGHTVEYIDGFRHIFHHFGSATPSHAATCFDRDFMVNPVIFGEEFAELQQIGMKPKCLISPDCRVTTVYDMILNQIIESARQANCHGSCGFGIYETRLRYELHPNHPHFSALIAFSDAEFYDFYDEIRRVYLPQRLAQLGLNHIPDDWQSILREDGLIFNSREDLLSMADRCEQYSCLPHPYDLLLFEGAQGLALDENNLADFPHLTPSSTGSPVPAQRIAEIDPALSTEILYISRSYLTRHGAGPLPTECEKDDICASMLDKTNVPNPFQKTLRYGRFEGQAARARIFSDFEISKRILPQATASILITHLNETNGKLAGTMSIDEFTQNFSAVYHSNSPFDIQKI